MRLSGWNVSNLGLTYAPVLLYAGVIGTFGILSPSFLSTENFLNIFVQCSAVAIVAIGMTFVLLTAGIDLSVGSIMFLCSAIAGTSVLHGEFPVALALLFMVIGGLFCGAVNGYFVARKGMAPFIVTLSMLFVARGSGLWITQTRSMNLPDTFRQLATTRLLGIPVPVLVLAVVVITAHLILTRTVFGRQLYAVGNNPHAAERAGIDVPNTLMAVYIISGACASIGGMITLAQLAAVSPNLGQGRELDVIAAAVLGGASLFGGRGTAFGAVLGAVLVETVRNGMNVIDADPYVYPVIIGLIIFAAVLLDSTRHRHLAKLRRRKIRTETS